MKDKPKIEDKSEIEREIETSMRKFRRVLIPLCIGVIMYTAVTGTCDFIGRGVYGHKAAGNRIKASVCRLDGNSEELCMKYDKLAEEYYLKAKPWIKAAKTIDIFDLFGIYYCD